MAGDSLGKRRSGWRPVAEKAGSAECVVAPPEADD